MTVTLTGKWVDSDGYEVEIGASMMGGFPATGPSDVWWNECYIEVGGGGYPDKGQGTFTPRDSKGSKQTIGFDISDNGQELKWQNGVVWKKEA